MRPVYHFKLSVWNRAETELKCNTGIRKNLIPLAFYHTRTGGAWSLLVYPATVGSVLPTISGNSVIIYLCSLLMHSAYISILPAEMGRKLN